MLHVRTPLGGVTSTVQTDAVDGAASDAGRTHGGDSEAGDVVMSGSLRDGVDYMGAGDKGGRLADDVDDTGAGDRDGGLEDVDEDNGDEEGRDETDDDGDDGGDDPGAGLAGGDDGAGAGDGDGALVDRAELGDVRAAGDGTRNGGSDCDDEVEGNGGDGGSGGDGDDGNAEGGVADAGVAPTDDSENASKSESVDASPTRARQLCWRLPTKKGRCRWVIAGPVGDHRSVNVHLFTTALVVESLPDLSSREVYARAVPMLVKKGVYRSVAAAHESILYAATDRDDAGSSAKEPSWEVDTLGTLPVRRILDRAATAVTQSGGRVDRGYVKFISFVPLPSHPWYAYAIRLRSRRDERRGAVAYRHALSRLTDDDERRLLRAGNSAALVAVRHATTYDVRSPADKARGLRPTKKRPWRGIGAPDVIPSRKRLIGLKRRVFEQCSRVEHALLTLDKDGGVVTWRYMRGSGLSGVRQYKASDGTIKRLASHSHKQRKPDYTANASLRGTPGSSSGGACDPIEESPGTTNGNDMAGNPPRRPRDAAIAQDTGPTTAEPSRAPGDIGDNTPADLFSPDSILGDEARTRAFADETGGRLSADELTILRCSTLENADGTAPEVVVAVQFDPVAAMAAAIARRTVDSTVDEVQGSDAAWSLASDGGPVRRSSITLFTLTLSACWLFRGRTPMIPVLYILAGEHNMHSAIGDRLDALLGEAIGASYEVPVADVDRGGADDEAAGGAATQGHAGDLSCDAGVCDWRGPSLLRIVGDFAMLAHIMGMTGGSDDSRCPFWWPCAAGNFLSLSAHVSADGRTRTVSNVMRQWEFVCWQLARWCTLRNASLSVDAGSVLVRCPACRTTTPLPTTFQERVPCQAPGCQGRSLLALPVVSPTPLTDTLHRLRRRAGGVRGYPVIRCVPIVLQVPVLHCTGSLIKKITHFFLAELGEAPRVVARQGMYGVTGRSTLRQLYLREHIKLAALIVACEDIVGVQVDSAIMSMWSMALLLTAAWRQALTGEVSRRGEYIAVLELAAGLLAPLWSSLKPLDKESKGTGVTSLYLHAALVHARASMADISSAQAIITDDHAEGAVREIGRHCSTRVNNVARAQAVTEYQALADDDAVAKPRTGFAAEVMVYTECIHICSCVDTNCSAEQKADLDEAVKRAGSSGVISVTAADEEEGTPLSLHMPPALVFRPDLGASAGKTWESKEEKVATALKSRMRVVKMCICGNAWGRDIGALGRRLAALRADDSESSTSMPADAAALTGHFSRAPDPARRLPPSNARVGVDVEEAQALRHPVRHTGERGSAGHPRLLDQDDARVWMHRHSRTCIDSARVCDGTCTEPRAASSDVRRGADGPLLERDDDSEEEDADAVHPIQGSRPEACRDSRDTSSASPGAVPFLASEALKDPVLRKFAPPANLLKRMLCDDVAGVWDGDVDANSVRQRIREEDTMLRLFLVRTQQPAFVNWAKSESLYLEGMREAIKRVLARLHAMSVSLPDSGAFTF